MWTNPDHMTKVRSCDYMWSCDTHEISCDLPHSLADPPTSWKYCWAIFKCSRCEIQTSCLNVRLNNITYHSLKFVSCVYMSYREFLLYNVLVKALLNKRAQRALGRSPDEKVKGRSGAIYRGLLMLSTKSRGPLDNVIHQIWKLWALGPSRDHS